LGNLTVLRRLVVYLGLVAALALAGLALVYWALFACAPPALPGDELWLARQNAAEALHLVLTAGGKVCFTGDTAASFALWLGSRAAGSILVLFAAIVLWRPLAAICAAAGSACMAAI